MRFRCPFCYYTISVDDMSRGYPVVCAGCGKEVLIPPGRFDPGCIIGDFVILEKLGAGSIGTVYKATQLSLDRLVALKILSPEYTTSKGIEDFLREARAAAKLTHTNLVQSYAVGEDDGFCYMAMTYVNGENLRTRLRREGRIPVDEALHITQQVAEALYYAWDEAGLIHRDVKPDNIMITDDGIVKLTDLGLAMNQSEWHEGMDVSGSPSYMSPEQFRGEKLDPRSDVYSLGVSLYQMISGRLPFESDSVKKLAEMHLEKETRSRRSACRRRTGPQNDGETARRPLCLHGRGAEGDLDHPSEDRAEQKPRAGCSHNLHQTSRLRHADGIFGTQSESGGKGHNPRLADGPRHHRIRRRGGNTRHHTDSRGGIHAARRENQHARQGQLLRKTFRRPQSRFRRYSGRGTQNSG